MADYFAVLQRTLSGFTDPKPQLRTKLYERARTTIERQLGNRVPPVTGAALDEEMYKLELAIAGIEREYDPSYPDPVPQGTQPAPAPEPVAEVAAEPVPEPTVETPPLPEPEAAVDPEPVVAQPVPESPVSEQFAVEQVAEVLEQPVDVSTQPSFPDPELPEIEIPPALAPAEPIFEPAPVPDEVPVHTFNPLDVPPVEEVPAQASPVAAEADAVDMWAKEFLETQNPPTESLPPVADLPAAAPIAASTTELPAADPVFDPVYDAAIAPVDPALQPSPAPVAAPGPIGTDDQTLLIPPAPGFGEQGSKRPKRRVLGKILAFFLFLAILGSLGYYGWNNRDSLIETFGLSSLFEDPNDPTKPKPVKTISITPDPEQPEDPVEAPKNESRLGSNGEEITPPEPTATPETTTPDPVVTPQPADTTVPATGVPPVSQSAILYEEGASTDQNSIDTGRVVWSQVEETPAAGQPAEPAIRGRIEIPSRNAVLVMTIKRNADKALPASHLIELVFAVPEDFSGGAINQISRFVLKESEQGRGEGLVGVPARIADGIFLIALNNLEEAQQKNETLLKTREWIDIPMQYSTGRRALMTIEKGVPGEKVFNDVFDAWSKL